MNPEEFWRLTYYDYQLICLRVLRKRKEIDGAIMAIQAMFRRIYHVIFSTAVGQSKRLSESELWPIPELDNEVRQDFVDRVRAFEQKLIKNGGRIR